MWASVAPCLPIPDLFFFNLSVQAGMSVTICHIRSPLMNLTGCEIRFVLFGPDCRVTEWSLITRHIVRNRDVHCRNTERIGVGRPQAIRVLGWIASTV
jgi:hypothetical protein